MSETSSAVNTSSSPPASPRQVLLGLFILFQLAFMIVSNMLGFLTWIPTEVKDRPRQRINQLMPRFADELGHGWSWSEQVEASLRRWVQLTGQDQDWALFAPGVAKATGFPAVVLLWDEVRPEERGLKAALLAFDRKNGFNICVEWNPTPVHAPSWPVACQLELLMAQNPWELLTLQTVCLMKSEESVSRLEFLLSDNEPRDINDFIRVGRCRVRRYEGQLYLNPQPYENETAEEFSTRMSRRLRSFVREYHDPALEYLKWRLHSWQLEHRGETMPKQVILFERFYRIHGPDEPRGWDGPMLIPFARWQPSVQLNESYYALEPFDFTEQHFLPINR